MSIARLLWLLLCCFVVQAETSGRLAEVQDAHLQLVSIEQELADYPRLSSSEEKELRSQLVQIRAVAETCIKKTDAELKELQPQQSVLKDADQPPTDAEKEPGPDLSTVPEGELAGEIARQKQAIESRLTLLGERRILCNLLMLRVGEMQARIDELIADQLSRRILSRNPNLWQTFRGSLSPSSDWEQVTEHLQEKFTDWQFMTLQQRGALLGMMFVGLLIGYWVSRQFKPKLMQQRPENATFNLNLHQSMLGSLVRFLPFLIMVAIARIHLMITVPSTEKLFAFVIVDSLLIYFAFLGVIRMLFKPIHPDPELQALPLPENFSKPFSRQAHVFLLLGAFYLLLNEMLFDEGVDPLLIQFSLDIWGTTLVLNMIWIVWLTRRIPDVERFILPHILLTLVLLASLVVGWAGFDNLAQLILFGILGTLVLLAVAFLVSEICSEIFDGLDEGRSAWHLKIRNLLGIHGKNPIPGLFGVRFLAAMGIWLSFILLLPTVWGLSDQINQQLWRILLEGFSIAGIQLVPAQLFMAILLLVVLLTLVRWFKTRLETRWLLKSRLAVGAKEALVTTSGYVGFTIAFLIAVSVAGISFSNLAIVAGALSVGIGFGLQNVVNNFVSGLIMLIERPVQKGDWIVVGETEGTVKRISIRTTIIQTFDRGDVIVPNSELISQQVTNWVLLDRIGRLKVPIGVAYGSDTSKVRDILLEVANKHPQLLRNHAVVSDPTVLFLGFGASSLQFELRGFVRDVDSRVTVISEINFSIDAAFREHNIEVPFPQQDVHIRTPVHLTDKPKPVKKPPPDPDAEAEDEEPESKPREDGEDGGDPRQSDL